MVILHKLLVVIWFCSLCMLHKQNGSRETIKRSAFRGALSRFPVFPLLLCFRKVGYIFNFRRVALELKMITKSARSAALLLERPPAMLQFFVLYSLLRLTVSRLFAFP